MRQDFHPPLQGYAFSYTLSYYPVLFMYRSYFSLNCMFVWVLWAQLWLERIHMWNSNPEDLRIWLHRETEPWVRWCRENEDIGGEPYSRLYSILFYEKEMRTYKNRYSGERGHMRTLQEDGHLWAKERVLGRIHFVGTLIRAFYPQDPEKTDLSCFSHLGHNNVLQQPVV